MTAALEGTWACAEATAHADRWSLVLAALDGTAIATKPWSIERCRQVEMGNQVRYSATTPVGLEPLRANASDAEVRAAIAYSGSVRTSELAKALDISWREALTRLRLLKKTGLVQRQRRRWSAAP